MNEFSVFSPFGQTFYKHIYSASLCSIENLSKYCRYQQDQSIWQIFQIESIFGGFFLYLARLVRRRRYRHWSTARATTRSAMYANANVITDTDLGAGDERRILCEKLVKKGRDKNIQRRITQSLNICERIRKYWFMWQKTSDYVLVKPN